jgi:hypothetical protein
MSAQVESSFHNLAAQQAGTEAGVDGAEGAEGGESAQGESSLPDADGDESSEQQQAVPESAVRALEALCSSEDLYAVCSQLGVDVGNKESSEAYVQPRGLINTGNTCFLNSSAQVGAGCQDSHGVSRVLDMSFQRLGFGCIARQWGNTGNTCFNNSSAQVGLGLEAFG